MDSRMTFTNECLLIDDDADDQEIFLMALEKVDKNIHCTVAHDAFEGLRKLSADNAFTPRHIFLDLNMPRMNGLECLREIKKLGHLSDSKVIMFSTSSDARAIEASRQLGADDYIVKPSGFDVLVKTLTSVIEK